MSLRLYDTGTRKVRDFVPRVPGKVSIYLCGLTLQGPPHIGHLRNGVNYDIMCSWFQHRGLDVTYVRNVTDIEDKVLAKSREQDRPWWAISFENERRLAADYEALGVRPPTYEPRATGHVPEMMDLIAELINKGHAYAPGNGDVYFSVESYPEYGALSHRKPEDMLCPDDGDESVKRDPRDFALWKAAKPGEPADSSWNTPYGRGRPGWHLECSAMSRRYLGDAFDIHGGGTDLMFPHHENELAQSRAAGLDFTNFWVHNNMVNLSGTKMSKSLGNVLSVEALGERGFRPVEIRYYLAAPHYRSVIDYSDAILTESATSYRRLENFVSRAAERFGHDATEGGALCADFTAALDDDFGTPAAFAAIHEVTREGNAALDSSDDAAARGAAASVRAMLGVLNLDPLSRQWTETGGDDLTPVVDSLVNLVLEQRQQARKNKDYATADAIRDQLSRAGLVIEDGPQGSRWSLARADHATGAEAHAG
ncbi:cysteine--tRNA ligase [Stackebrandtia nassauensis]|uniref:Cysteine--tRNA ligase n=1 Tax=Stackebrandtia nassauensis (strain DSM 44728 / CIP 108903 / NRRL B-16338 / NBRC 102104 / LLR-40K-21) TaxID=446470 RepID=D3Q4B2_STANL|nr:cysteine--tRNA ligase [Stackebrandtia nassauensis]ADD40072.1 cysteinyl-tRNA synthetase [Stackebrandtia nassauensis DSM 44728]